MKRVRVLVLAVGAWSCAAFSQAVPAGNFTPVRAQLLRGIHAAQLMVGETFLLKTSAEWQGNGCTVRKDTLVTARVSTLERAARPTSLGVRFDPVPCSESERGAVRPLLIALQAEHAVPDDSLGRLSTAGSEASAISSLFSPSRPGMPTSSDTMLTSANAVATTSYAGYTRAPEVPLVTGEVRGLRGVSMQLPSGSAETKLSTRARDISVREIRGVPPAARACSSRSARLGIRRPACDRNTHGHYAQAAHRRACRRLPRKVLCCPAGSISGRPTGDGRLDRFVGPLRPVAPPHQADRRL